jgi:hypothetical protein
VIFPDTELIMVIQYLRARRAPLTCYEVRPVMLELVDEVPGVAATPGVITYRPPLLPDRPLAGAVATFWSASWWRGGLCFAGSFQAEPEAKVGGGRRQQRESVVHDPVAEDGKDRGCPRRPETDGDGHYRHLHDAQPTGRDGDGAGDFRCPVGDCQRPEAGLVAEGEKHQVEREQIEQQAGCSITSLQGGPPHARERNDGPRTRPDWRPGR